MISQLFNVYCDESCHLENDHHPIMVLGAVWCPKDRTRQVAEEIRAIKLQHGLSSEFEIKWTKVSPAKQDFYLQLVDYFFDNPDLHFRALIAPKSNLRHEEFNQDHNLWYYKMYFDMLKIILNPVDHYRIYIDIKDTNGGEKVHKLHEVLSNSIFDFSREIIENVQIVRSNEIEVIQLADLLIGIISGVSRPPRSEAKNALIERMRLRSQYTLTRSTLYQEMKVNLFYWMPK